MTWKNQALAGIAGMAFLACSPLAISPAIALVVYDPSNYAQNVLTAARTLQQINNQIRQIQNQAQSLLNQARNLESLPLDLGNSIQQQLRQTQQLVQQAQGIAYNVQNIETRFGTQYKSIDLSASDAALVSGAQERWQTSVAAFEDALKVQAGAVGNIEGTRTAVGSLVSASQSSQGALQAAQAGNQLLALQSQQLADLTATVAAQGRAQALDAAKDAAAKVQAREQLRRFLTGGTGYVPGNAQLFHE
jgi:P-type conjugative transfer protein TrbJ